MWAQPEITSEAVAAVIWRFALSWLAAWPWIGVATALFCLVRWRPSTWPLTARQTRHTTTLLVVVAACTWALHLGWVGDDAFISFRYVNNWVDGHGLVYNVGERVEGYTNFLWLVVLAPFRLLGLPLPQVSVALSLACLATTLVLTARLAHRLTRDNNPAARFPDFSIAALLLGLNYVFASFGTSGLETAMGAMLVLAALERAEQGATLAAGTLGIFATLTHPDHAIFYVCLGVAVLVEARSSGRARIETLLRYAIPFVVLYLPYFAWRYRYYGDFFPNTYYAKNANLTYFSQGLRYLALSGMQSGLWAMLPAAIVGLVTVPRGVVTRFTVLALPLFLIYVAKIGGDFMLGRLLCPLLPPVYILAEVGLRRLVRPRPGASDTAGALVLGLACTCVVPARFIGPRENYAHIADERTYYPIQSYRPFALDNAYWHWSHALNETFSDLSRKPTLAMFSVGIMGHETGLPMVDNAGLTHRGLAHWRNRGRGRPGHEKLMNPPLLVQSGADLSDVPVFPQPYEDLGLVNVRGIAFHTVHYDEVLFAELRDAGITPPALLQYIDAYRPPHDSHRLSCDLWHFEEIYFRHTRDEARRSELLRRIVHALPPLEGYRDFLLGTPGPTGNARWVPVTTMGFDTRHPRAQLAGDSFLDSPSQAQPAGQAPAAGAVGPYVNSYTEASGNQAQGSFTSEPFEIVGEVMTLMVGGGFQLDRLRVELTVDGRPVVSATGCDSLILGRKLWLTGALLGETARLNIVDDATTRWGHIVVDELVQWKQRPRPPAATKTVETAHTGGAQ